MAPARQELGPDAMLVNSRKAPPEARHLGEYEVVFAIDAPGDAAKNRPLPASPAATAWHRRRPAVGGSGGTQEGTGRHAARDHAHGLSRRPSGAALRRICPTPMPRWPPPKCRRNWLARSSKPPKRGWTATAHTPARVRRRTDGRFRAGAGRGIGIALHRASRCWDAAKPSPRIVALVGPPGSGKTTTLVKLAVNYGLAGRRPVLLLSMDTYRVAAADQLRSYAAILGVGFQVARNGSGAGAGDRGKSRQGTDPHRHPGLGARRPGSHRPALAQFLSTRGRYRHATGRAGFHEIRRSIPCGGCFRDIPAAAAAVHQTG